MFTTCLERETIERIVASPAVQELAGKPRYSVFMHPETSTNSWINMTDCDFDNRTHLFKTAVLAQGIADTEGVDRDATHQAVLTGMVHDAAESIVGDKCFHNKTEADEDEEIDLLDSLVDSNRLKLTRDELALVKETMQDKKNGPETKAGTIFDISEVYGYQLSALTAWNGQKTNSDSTRFEQQHLQRLLAINVTAVQLAILIGYHNKGYRTPRILFDNNTETIDAIFNFGADPRVMDDHTEHCHRSGFGHKAEILRENFVATSGLWLAYRSMLKPQVA